MMKVLATVAVSLAVLSGCSADGEIDGLEPEGIDDSAFEGQAVSFVVNGRRLTASEEKWVRAVARDVVPRLRGTQSERLSAAARVSWWSLKEGVFDVGNPIAYSNCNYASGDARIGPLTTCVPGRAWQVGLSGVQVSWLDPARVEATARALYPDKTIRQVLALTASQAGFAAGGSTYNAIVGSSGSLRLSWLLRNSAIGFTHQLPTVVAECINDSKYWCFGSGWDTSSWYAPTKSAALRSIEDLKRILGGLSTTTTAPSTGTSWSCASSSYNSRQYWTCSDGDRYRCSSGVPQKEDCARGCLGRAVGTDDLCIAATSSWTCGRSSYGGEQWWTCNEGSLYRCDSAGPTVVKCPNGCDVGPLGTDDKCR